MIVEGYIANRAMQEKNKALHWSLDSAEVNEKYGSIRSREIRSNRLRVSPDGSNGVDEVCLIYEHVEDDQR